MTDLPVRPIVMALAGTCALDDAPTDAIFPSRMMSVWSLRGAAPVPSITRAWVSATIAVSTDTYCCVAVDSNGRCAAASVADVEARRPAATKERNGIISLEHGLTRAI